MSDKERIEFAAADALADLRARIRREVLEESIAFFYDKGCRFANNPSEPEFEYVPALRYVIAELRRMAEEGK